MGDYRKLDVWRLSHDLTLDVYRVTRHFPNAEQFGITTPDRALIDRTDQVRRMLAGLITAVKRSGRSR